MIKTRNLGEFQIILTLAGTQSATAGSNTKSGIVPFAARLKAVVARLGVAGVTGAQTVDLLKGAAGGVQASVMASGNFLSFATTSRIPTYGNATLSADPTLFNAYDTVQIKNTAIHSGTAAIDLVVVLTFERQRGGSFNDKLQTETIGADSDAIG